LGPVVAISEREIRSKIRRSVLPVAPRTLKKAIGSALSLPQSAEGDVERPRAASRKGSAAMALARVRSR